MVPLVWRRVLRATRVAVGSCCVVAEAFGAGLDHPVFLLIFSLYTIYAIAILLWPDLEEEVIQPTWTLAIDGVVLLVALSSSSPHFELVATLLYAFVMATAVILHDWWRPLVTAALCVVVLNLVQPAHLAVLFPCLIGGGLLASVLALERHFLRERLSNTARQGVMYRYDAENARESERQRIAGDFHDGPLQSFISFQMRLEIIRKLMARDSAAALEELHQLQDLGRSQVQELRAFIRSMSPGDTEGSLNFLLRRAVDQFSKDSGIPASFISTEFVEPEEPETALELLQIVREALHNIQKHASATRVAVGISAHDQSLEISVEDNGKGFPFSGSYNLEELELLCIGPGSVKRRVRSLGGEMVLDSRPGHGAGLKIRLNG